MDAKLTRASRGSSEGFSLWVFQSPYLQKQTLQAVNDNFSENYLPGKSNKFNVVVELGNAVHRLRGHCNIKRGDFYINRDHWIMLNGLVFGFDPRKPKARASQILCRVISVDQLA